MNKKLHNKLSYAIDLGINFLLRNINANGFPNLERHCLATLCLLENIKSDKTEILLTRIAKNSYIDNNHIFIVCEGKEQYHLNVLAALCFLLSDKQNWASKCVNRITEDQEKYENKYMAQCIYLFTKMYEKTQEQKWLDKAKASAAWIVNNETNLSRY